MSLHEVVRVEANRHSQTAIIMAAARAAHTAGPPPRIFEDTLAAALLSREERNVFASTSAKLREQLQPGATVLDADAAVREALRIGPGVNVLARARYVEDSLFSSLNEGIVQYVILGAGLDTFALRHPYLADRLRVVEVDHPATQAFKLARMAQSGLPTPGNLHLVAADLERESIAQALGRTRYDPSVPAFFAWPGVAYYLTLEAVFETLRSIGSIAAPGSHLVFDYFEAGALAPQAPPRIRLVVERARQNGEAMKSSLDPATLPHHLAQVGLALVEDLGPDQIQERVLANFDGFQAVEYWHFVTARKAA